MGFIFGFIAFGWPLLILADVILLGVFSAALSVGFYNVSNGRKKQWPAQHIAGSIISFVIAAIALLMAVIFSYNFIGSFF